MRSSTLKTVTDIVAVGNLYTNIMKRVNHLAGIKKRFRTERFVFDIQVGGGGKIFTIILNISKSLFVARIRQMKMRP